jgi:dTDP-glucose pyrophosphorylase
MLLDPRTGKPLIYYSVELAISSGLKPIIIYSENKTKLRKYLEEEFGKKACIFVRHNPHNWEEWPHSVLSSEKHWGRINFLILPDTRFEPDFEAIKQLRFELNEKKKEVAFATIKVDDGSKYAVVNSSIGDIILTAEKPKSLSGKAAQAWIILGFNRKRGRLLFDAYSKKHTQVGFPKDQVGIVELKRFKDITRNGFIEYF